MKFKKLALAVLTIAGTVAAASLFTDFIVDELYGDMENQESDKDTPPELPKDIDKQ